MCPVTSNAVRVTVSDGHPLEEGLGPKFSSLNKPAARNVSDGHPLEEGLGLDNALD